MGIFGMPGTGGGGKGRGGRWDRACSGGKNRQRLSGRVDRHGKGEIGGGERGLRSHFILNPNGTGFAHRPRISYQDNLRSEKGGGAVKGKTLLHMCS